MNLILSQRSQIQKATCCMTPFMWHSGEGKLLETENRSVMANSQEDGLAERLTTKGHERTFWSDGNVLYSDFVVGYMTVAHIY